MNRREFLLRSGLTAGAFSLGGALMPRVARAAEVKDRYFVFCYFEGGWDALISLDPRNPAEFNDGNMLETGIQPGYDRLPGQFSRQNINAGPFTLGPCCGELPQIADKFSVIRGINMATLTHEVGRRYFITGKEPAGLNAQGSSIATLAASQIAGGETPDRPVPHLAHRVESYNIDQPAFATAMPVAAVGHMQYILQDTLGIPTGIRPNVRGALGAYWSKRRDCAPGRGASATAIADAYRSNRARARDVVTTALYSQFQFDAPELAGVREHYGINAGLLETPRGRAALASQALRSGLSRVVSVVLADGLDTHDGNWANEQSTRLSEGFTALARLITDLDQTEAPGGGGSLLSKTTIVAFSEFNRTPRLNERNGRDHHLGNCAVVAGGGIQPGKVIGASSDLAMGPLHIDLASGQADESGVSLSPTHVMATALQSGGLDASDLRIDGIPGLLA
ncbi:MAG: DUF1501 domain-containing protein [Bradymonadia bacterium]